MFKYLLLITFILNSYLLIAQNITGVWHATIQKKGSNLLSKKYNLELKIIANGDSISGTSYYYKSKHNFSRYSIKGVRDPINNVIKWWDDELIEGKTPQLKLGEANSQAFNINADFSCYDGVNMFLDGTADIYNNTPDPEFNFNGKKVKTSIFNDEWDWLIDNFTSGANTKKNIDSIGSITINRNKEAAYLASLQARNKQLEREEKELEKEEKRKRNLLKDSKMVSIGSVPNSNVINKEKIDRIYAEYEEVKVDSSSFVSNPFFKGLDKKEVKTNTQIFDNSQKISNEQKQSMPKDTIATNKQIDTLLIAKNNPILNSIKIPEINKEQEKLKEASSLKEAPPPSSNNINIKEKELIKMDSLRSYVSLKDSSFVKVPLLKPIDLATNTLIIPQNAIIAKLEKRITQQVTSIPIYGDTIILRFYDNATIDGDSIAVFLNKQLIQEHILLSFEAYEIKIPTNTLLANNELVMVAENLGSVPPNTSTVVVYVNQKRYEVNLESTEQKSASIRFYLPQKQ